MSSRNEVAAGRRNPCRNRLLTVMSNMDVTDLETCYEMFRAEVIQTITMRENGFGMQSETTAKAAKMGCSIYEVGVVYSGRAYAEEEKLRWRDGFRAIYCILTYNLLQ